MQYTKCLVSTRMSEQSEKKHTRGTLKSKKKLSFSESIRRTPALAEGTTPNLLFSVAPEVGDIDLFPTCWGVLSVGEPPVRFLSDCSLILALTEHFNSVL